MEKHTKEPWKTKGQDIIGGELNGYVGTWSGHEGNANRIVACVNACEGISDEALEGGVVREMLEALKKLYEDGIGHHNVSHKDIKRLINKAKRQTTTNHTVKGGENDTKIMGNSEQENGKGSKNM